ncbi:MAG: DNA polymerase III subunit beta [Syntrophomonadaceae bacterium]|nr:DNA polymerase III subunit beta [Syntrophomonadaceae bacterium]
MKFSIAQPELARITSVVQRAASTRDTVPVLSGLLIQASQQNGLTLSATDLEIAIQANTPAVSVEDDGTVLTNARYFSELVRFLPENDLVLSTDETRSRLVITYGRSESHLNLYNPEEYPDLPVNNLQHLLSLPQIVLKEALRKTAFAAAANHFRQVFTGVLFDIESDRLRVVASDTHRLALMNIALDTPASQPQQFVVPARTVNELTRVLDDSTEPISIGFTNHSVVFYRTESGFYIISRLLEGQYPNYLPVIPQNFVASLTLDTRSLANSLERAILMPGDKQATKQSIRNVVLDIKEHELNLSSYSEKMGELNEVIENTVLEGESGLQVAFNTRYFLDIVRILQNEASQLSLHFTGSCSPALIKDPQNDNYLYVLVPLLAT